MLHIDAPDRLFYANLLAATGGLDAAIGMVEAAVDLRWLAANQISDEEFRDRYPTV